MNPFIIAIVVLIVLYLCKQFLNRGEGWGSSPGAMIQLATSRPYYSVPHNPRYLHYYGYQPVRGGRYWVHPWRKRRGWW